MTEVEPNIDLKLETSEDKFWDAENDLESHDEGVIEEEDNNIVPSIIKEDSVFQKKLISW